jgi:predicted nuclease of predicted toxin-antitoxin system
MKFLADENFPRPAVRALRQDGLEVAWATEVSPGSMDEDVLARCTSDRLTLLTLDKDFGELVFHRGLPAECGVILF